MRGFCWLRSGSAIAFVCLVSLLLAPAACAQYTAVSASYIGGSSSKVASATLYMQPVNGCTPNVGPGSARVGSTSGQIKGLPYTATVTTGVVSLSVPDALQTAPNIAYATTAIDNTSGNVIFGAGLDADGVHVKTGGPYGCLQPTGSTWNLDTFQPAATSSIVPAAGSTVLGNTTFNAPVVFSSTLAGTNSSFSGTVSAGGNALSSPVNIQQYGIVCDGITVNLGSAVATAFNSAPSLTFPPGSICLVSGWISLNNQSHPTPPGGGKTRVDMNGSVIWFIDTGDSTRTRSDGLAVSVNDTFIDPNGYIQLVTQAGTLQAGAPSYSSNYGIATVDGTARLTNWGIAPYHWVPNTTWYVGQKINSGGFMYRVEAEGVSGASLPALDTAPGNATSSTGAPTWRNIGPPATTVGCGNGYNGLLRISSPYWLFENGTLEAANSAATCIVNLSALTVGGFGYEVTFKNVNFTQPVQSPDKLTNTDGIYAVNQDQLEVQGGTFGGALGRAIVSGDWAQTVTGDYCDRAVIRNNVHFARVRSHFQKAPASTPVTVGQIFSTDAATDTTSKAGYAVIVTSITGGGVTGSTAPTWPTVVGNSVTWGGATLKLIQIPVRYDPIIYGFFTGASTVADDNFEWGPAALIQSRLFADVFNFDGNLGTDGTPDYWARIDNTVANAAGNQLFSMVTGFSTGIIANPQSSCNIERNIVNNSAIGISTSLAAGSTSSCKINGNTIKGASGGRGIVAMGGHTSLSDNTIPMGASDIAIELGGSGNKVGVNALVGKIKCDAQFNDFTGDPAQLDSSCATSTNRVYNTTNGSMADTFSVKPSTSSVSEVSVKAINPNTGGQATLYLQGLSNFENVDLWSTSATTPMRWKAGMYGTTAYRIYDVSDDQFAFLATPGTGAVSIPGALATSEQTAVGLTLAGLSNPSAPSGTASGSSGSVPDSAFNYAQIVAVTPSGVHTLPSSLSSAVTTSGGGTQSIVWTWTAVPNAFAYQVWTCQGSGCTPANYFTAYYASYTQKQAPSSGTAGTLPTSNNTTGKLTLSNLTASRPVWLDSSNTAVSAPDTYHCLDHFDRVPCSVANYTTPTELHADLTSTQLLAAANNIGGKYTITGTVVLTTQATTGTPSSTSTLPGPKVIWTDYFTGTANPGVQFGANYTGNLLGRIAGQSGTGSGPGIIEICSQANTVISVATTGYASNTAGEMGFKASYSAKYEGPCN